MKINDVLQKDGRLLRILDVRERECFCIDCNTTCMPAWISISRLEGYAEGELSADTDNLSPTQDRDAHQRYTMIAPILAFLTNDIERNRMIRLVCEQYHISRQTIKRYLCRYLSE